MKAEKGKKEMKKAIMKRNRKGLQMQEVKEL
jgi:hypothetical protein